MIDSFMSGLNWYHGFQNNDSVARTADAQVFCGTDVKNWQYVDSSDIPIPAGQEATATAVCPQGTWIVGGGGTQWGTKMIRMTDSQPNYVDQSWVVHYHDDDPFDGTIVAQVICGN